MDGWHIFVCVLLTGIVLSTCFFQTSGMPVPLKFQSASIAKYSSVGYKNTHTYDDFEAICTKINNIYIDFEACGIQTIVFNLILKLWVLQHLYLSWFWSRGWWNNNIYNDFEAWWSKNNNIYDDFEAICAKTTLFNMILKPWLQKLCICDDLEACSLQGNPWSTNSLVLLPRQS